MLYPAELRAQHETTNGDSDYSGNSEVDEAVGRSARFRRARITLPPPKYFLFHSFNNLLAVPVRCHDANVNLSHQWQFLLCQSRPPALFFRRLKLADRVLQLRTDEVARNGAPLKINFGQRFSWTPLAFSLQPGFNWPTAPSPDARAFEFTPAPASLGRPVPPVAAVPQSPAP
jgi:hypothetical protein